MIKFGGSSFENCSVPLAFEGRYFILEPGEIPLVSVIIEHEGKPVFEVIRNEPADNPLSEVSKTPPGVITVSEKSSGKFLYKIRPDSDTSIVFGKIDGSEISALINDRRIKVGGIDIENCTFSGVGAGIVVDKNGSVGIGAPISPILRQWFQK